MREAIAEPISTAYGLVRLSRSRMCRGLGIPRSWLYREPRSTARPGDEEIVRAIQRIKKVHRYGYRRVAKALRKRHKRTAPKIVNHKRILRIMRAHGMTEKPRKRYRWRGTSRAAVDYGNAPQGIAPSRPNQMWFSDFTQVPIFSRPAYVAIVEDGFSRRCIGWNVHSRHNLDLTLPALRMALVTRRPKPGFVHHSDQGSEYMAFDYVGLVEEHGGVPSASRKGTPTDNPFCESFIKTLKHEKLLDHEYSSIDELRDVVRKFVKLYNEERIHSSLGDRSPAEFERTYYAARKRQP